MATVPGLLALVLGAQVLETPGILENLLVLENGLAARAQAHLSQVEGRPVVMAPFPSKNRSKGVAERPQLYKVP